MKQLKISLKSKKISKIYIIYKSNKNRDHVSFSVQAPIFLFNIKLDRNRFTLSKNKVYIKKGTIHFKNHKALSFFLHIKKLNTNKGALRSYKSHFFYRNQIRYTF
ncbi:MAG: hypothetical protein GY830_04440 [Bacteroidetes bacterium]|nr:hypothetical protein [Bacteroidota bacterium]